MTYCKYQAAVPNRNGGFVVLNNNASADLGMLLILVLLPKIPLFWMMIVLKCKKKFADAERVLHMKKRLISAVICLALLLGMMPALTPTVKAATANQNNIVARADYLYNITWLCQKTVSGWCGNYTFYSGTAYHLPYGQPIYSGAYIGYGVSVDSFISSTKSASSVFYTSRSTYGSTNSVYYATDCSAFVSWCWGIDRKTTYSIPLTSGVTYIGMATTANTSKLQLGDCLNSNDVGHVVLVTDLIYNSSGTLTQIEITEQTPPQLKRSYYTPSELGSYYGGYYGIYRYTGAVPGVPVTVTEKYYPSCDSSYTSLYPALESIGVYCDWTLHCQIAERNGIVNFSGTVEQNTQLLDLLKAGKLLNPNYTGTDTEDETGSFVNGYLNGYNGGMAGDGKIYAHGLDVSEWQGTSLNFNSIKNAGYDYVILRAGTTNGKDNCFESYYTKARAAGLDIGAYYYTYATTVSGAKTDADNMLSWISGKTFEYPVYLDYEDSSQDSLSSTTAKNICLTFCDAMAEAGYLTGVYTGYYKSTQLPMSEICAKYEVWIANYWDYGYETLSPSYSTQYGMYQYTDRNYIGNNGPYDGDVAFKDYPAIVKQYGFNGYGKTSDYFESCTFYPSYCRVTTTQSTPLNSLPCSASSSQGSYTLLKAEEGESYLSNGLYLNDSGNFWYQVTLEGGEAAYLYAGHTSFIESVGTDISLDNGTAPGELLQGQSFDPQGMVSARWNTLNEVQLSVSAVQGLLGTTATSVTVEANDNSCDLSAATLDLTGIKPGNYQYIVTAHYSGYYATSAQEITAYTGKTALMSVNFIINADPNCEHSYTTKILQAATCTEDGVLERACSKCGISTQSTIVAQGHRYTATTIGATCTEAGGIRYTCTGCSDTFMDETEPAKGHAYSNGSCIHCAETDPEYAPVLTLKSPTLEFKDMITVNAFYTAENTQNVVEMGMITYSTKVSQWSVETAEHVIPGATYVESTGRYYSCSQGIHAKYLADTVYLAIYAKLANGSYVYSKLAGYSATQYAASQLKNSTDAKLKKLVVAMLNYGAEAQLYFGYNTASLANGALTADQKILPEEYRGDMVGTVPGTSTDKQGLFVNNGGFASRKPAISFEGAFCINYFFTPNYAPDSGITLYYWNAEDYHANSVLTTANATGKIKLEGSGAGEYRGDIDGIAAKSISEAVYVACAYKSGGNVWTSGVLGYSIGTYCSSQASKGNAISDLAMATAVYGYHAKQYFGQN